ncbi:MULTISPECIES: biotin-dependent carboxyltransferase family protein [unclassified Devosia]|uniref:biotin-dependent carboxyltransferase family protein n=1 Tax=unclassified Devosia TaxID=196773 RepID=UPI001553CF6B
MSATITILRAGPLTTIQDEGRSGLLASGISASGPMDTAGFALAADMLGVQALGGIEFTMAGLELAVTAGSCRIGFAGGAFTVRHNGEPVNWPGTVLLRVGDRVAITPGGAGNYGYLRFDGDLQLPAVLGSLATNSRAQLGGLAGRPLQAGDRLELGVGASGAPRLQRSTTVPADSAFRVVWGIHADLFSPQTRQAFVAGRFEVSPQMDRMGVRLRDAERVFAGAGALSLVSDAIVPGDIQILGDGTPIVLMRDHQPTGGYPRIATVISADLDRFAQQRPGTTIAFQPVTVEHAHRLLRGETP